MRCHLEWGVEGAHRAVRRGDAVVIVDTLSFSTGVTAAIVAGAEVYPVIDIERAGEFANTLGAQMAVKRRDMPTKGRFSLSPETLQRADPGTRIVLPSPNGARCSLAAKDSPLVCAGAIVNASEVGRFVVAQAGLASCNITIVACGEAIDLYHPDTSIRFALEDMLGAGAIASHLDCDKTPELRAAEAAFEAAKPNLHSELLACESGIELVEMGFPQDVEFAARCDVFSVVAVFDDEKYELAAG